MHEQEIDTKISKFFCQHLVPILFELKSKRNGDIVKVTITTFVMSVRAQWFLITAGHCIRDINEKLEFYELLACYLIDSLGIDAVHDYPIPFLYDPRNPYFTESYPFDYGVIPLSQYYVDLLSSNNIVALNEETWRKMPPSVDFVFLLGLPFELVKFDVEAIELLPLMIRVIPIEEKPIGFDEDNENVLYGIVQTDDLSIKGMSGGPIFSIYTDEDGQMRYFLTAIQSRWNSYSGEIGACYSELLGSYLEYLIEIINS